MQNAERPVFRLEVASFRPVARLVAALPDTPVVRFVQVQPTIGMWTLWEEGALVLVTEIVSTPAGNPDYSFAFNGMATHAVLSRTRGLSDEMILDVSLSPSSIDFELPDGTVIAQAEPARGYFGAFIDREITRFHDEPTATRRVDLFDFREGLLSIGTRGTPEGSVGSASIGFRADSSMVTITSDDDHPSRRVIIEAEAGSGASRCEIPAASLWPLARLIDDRDGECTISIFDDPARPAFLVQVDDLQVAIHRAATELSLEHERIAPIVEEAFGPVISHASPGGSYQLTLYGPPIRLQPIADGGAIVYGDVLTQVTESVELYRELNDQMYASAGLRLLIIDNAVVAAVDLTGEGLTTGSLIRAFDRVRRAIDLGGMLASAFGGSPAHDEDESLRWEAYSSTVVEIQIGGRAVPVMGPGTIEELPIPGPVHVLTGWNPSGRLTPESFNIQANQQLLHTLLGHGAVLAPAVGRSVDGSWSEDSFAVSGLDRATALEIGRSFEQESIFEITDNASRVIGVAVDRIVETPRNPQQRIE